MNKNKTVKPVYVLAAAAVIVAALLFGWMAAKGEQAADDGPVVEPARLSACDTAYALKQLGLFDDAAENDLDLAGAPTRGEAAAVLTRLLGEEGEALPDGWAGSGDPVTQDEYLTELLHALGRTEIDDDSLHTLAEEAGLLPADYQPSTFRRAEMAELSWFALHARVKGGGSLLAKLYQSGTISHEAIAACGLCRAAGIDCEDEGEFVPPAPGADFYPHTPAEAACNESLSCAICGEPLPGQGAHVPGPPSCLEDQVCTICGTVLAPASGHSYTASDDGMRLTCDVCGQIVNLKESTKDQKILPETAASGHYYNDIDAYYSGSVLVCGDYGLEYFSSSADGSRTYADMVNAFAQKYPDLNVTCLITPKSCAFQPPAGYNDVFQSQADFISATYGMMLDSVQKADCAGVMAEHRGEYMFYRTDHHWTSLGAYYASVAYCQANGITPRPLSSYQTVVNTGYVGSLYSFAGKPACLRANPDYTVAHLPEADCTMTYTTDGATGQGPVINTNTNGYASMFLCGDQAFEDIRTSNNTGRKLIVFKESYGNAFVPYMVDYYDEIIVIDIRKDTESVGSIIRNYGITDALIINNIQAVTSLNGYLSGKLAS